MTDLAKHACQDRGVVDLVRLADPAEAECAQRAAVALGLADLATNLRQLQLRHRSPSPPPHWCLTLLRPREKQVPRCWCLTPLRRPEQQPRAPFLLLRA